MANDPIKVESELDQGVIDSLVLNHFSDQLKRQIAASKPVEQAISKAINDRQSELTAAIDKAVAKALDSIVKNPTFIAELLSKALLKDADKLAGAFEASLRAAGKRLTLDADALKEVKDQVIDRLTAEAAARAALFESNGGGSFS